ncbi:aspartic proteinase CDR1-like [Malania oleifera]|uniref:aspartic proteinase CDR1-like n=1 Tax=Malania oleifera TaxID=397392 RepID=UPI0025ADBC1C|nr:aspartic proteinase CDR1-like [Malania oleifera]
MESKAIIAPLFILMIFAASLTEPATATGGFAVDLIRRDSPQSPFYKPSETPYARVRAALRRSINRANRFAAAVSKPLATSDGGRLSQVTPNNGEYLLNISIGTPPTQILAIADTGSDLIWTQCAPCTNCYKQNAPLFSPKKSSTYKTISCTATACTNYDSHQCGTNNGCEYSAQYGDQSYTIAVLSTDTVNVDTAGGKPVSLPNTIFGCGYNNNGTFDENESGIVGLGGGSYSAIAQMNSIIGGKFSYCLLPIGSGGFSKMNFGDDGAVSGSGPISTAIVSKAPDTHYYVTLESISVGSEKVDFVSNAAAVAAEEEGNIIIDSGTTLTFLPEEMYDNFEKAVKASIDLDPLEGTEGLLCYKSEKHIDVPVITAHFAGADVELNSVNTFVRTAEDTVCLSFVSSSSPAIFGNLAQVNLLVGFDLDARTVSFKPTDCSKL